MLAHDGEVKVEEARRAAARNPSFLPRARRVERITRLEEERTNRLQAIDANLTTRGLRLAGDARGADLAAFDNTAREEVRQLRETLFQLGLEGTADLQVRDGVIEIRAVRRNPREGWADDARRLAAQGGDVLVWPEVANEGDSELVW